MGAEGLEEREYPCGPLERTPGFFVAGREAAWGDTRRETKENDCKLITG